MMELIFATNNQHKVEEIRAILPANFSIITLKEAGIDIDIPEPHPTLEENAQEKARVIYSLTGLPCFSEDTGLEIDALNGAPGVRSARYTENDTRFKSNTEKLLFELSNKTDRRGRFRTVICLKLHKQEYLFTGECPGYIATAPSGNMGFGYDPVFIPDGSDKSFAQMTLEQKTRFSHRSKAFAGLVAFLNELP